MDRDCQCTFSLLILLHSSLWNGFSSLVVAINHPTTAWKELGDGGRVRLRYLSLTK